LIELLVVVAIVAILTGLLTPAIQGLTGTSGRRGGLNTITAVFEQARLAAIENGTTVFIGFPTNAADPTNGYSHLILLRAPRAGETGTNAVALTRWQRLPSGMYFQPKPNDQGFVQAMTNLTLTNRTVPRLGLEELTTLPALAFNRFGQLRGVTNNELVLLLGEKVDPLSGAWRGNANNHFELRIQPLTGRTIVRDMATNASMP
jgi:type II secretory pathway pseudopilin PulG